MVDLNDGICGAVYYQMKVYMLFEGLGLWNEERGAEYGINMQKKVNSEGFRGAGTRGRSGDNSQRKLPSGREIFESDNIYYLLLCCIYINFG